MNFRSIVVTALGIATIGFSVVPTSISQPTSPPKLVNLLSAENGGHLVTATGDAWLATIDEKDDFNTILEGLQENNEAVYAFKGERKARLEMFTMLINEADGGNVKEFELFVGNDSPTGSFESIGKFSPQNIKLYKTPFQQFKLPQVSAKYLKIRLLKTFGYPHPHVREVQLFGYMVDE
jgi:hypothetical protein